MKKIILFFLLFTFFVQAQINTGWRQKVRWADTSQEFRDSVSSIVYDSTALRKLTGIDSIRSSGSSTTIYQGSYSFRSSNRPTISLEDYNVVVDDSLEAGDNKRKLEQAISEASAFGVAIQLPRDTLWIDSLVLQNPSNVYIIGPGVIAYRDSVKDRRWQGMFTFLGGKDVVFKDVTFVGNQRMGASDGGHDNAVLPILMLYSPLYDPMENLVIKDCRFKDSWSISVSDSNSFPGDLIATQDTLLKNFVIDGNIWDDPAIITASEGNGNTAINFNGGFVINGFVGNNYLDGAIDGVIYNTAFLNLQHSSHVIVYANHVRNVFTSALYSQGQYISYIGNIIKNVGKDAIKNIYDLNQTRFHPDSIGYCVFIGNEIVGMGRFVLNSPVGINAEGVNNLISGNIIQSQDTTNYIAKQGHIAIRIRGYNNLVEGNKLYGRNDFYNGFPGSYGILLVDSTNNKGYNVFRNNVYNSWRVGIFIQYNPYYVSISNELFMNCDSIAVESAASREKYLIIRNNEVFGSEQVFRISQADSFFATGNIAIASGSLWGTGIGLPSPQNSSTTNYTVEMNNHRVGDTYWSAIRPQRVVASGQDSIRFTTSDGDTLLPKQQR